MMKPQAPRFTFPDCVGSWVIAVDLKSCSVSVMTAKDSPPMVYLHRKAGPDDRVLSAWAVQLRDGLHFRVSPGPNEIFHLALRNSPRREASMSVTAALMSAVAAHAVGPNEDRVAWMKKVHRQVLSAMEKAGAGALLGMGPVFVELNKATMGLVDKALGRDVDDAVTRVRKDFLFLVDRISEEDVVRLWREALVDKTHDH
jgi:hypothetical protein